MDPHFMKRLPHLLLVCPSFSERTGTELYVAEVAQYFSSRGWKVSIFSRHLGPLAEQMASASINVTKDLGVVSAPSLIHGHGYFESILACRRFPQAPLLFTSHSSIWWPQYAPKTPNLSKILAVDLACRDALIQRAGFPGGQIELLYNFVDIKKFKPRPPLPAIPKTALIFSNYATEENYVPAVREACEACGLVLDVAGSKSDHWVSGPEELLPKYDIVFAIARCALEAMAVGCGVVLCGTHGVGPFVTSGRIDQLRPLNFGWRTLTEPHASKEIIEQIKAYDAVEARHVCDAIRKEAGLEQNLQKLEGHYNQLLEQQGTLKSSTGFGYTWADLALQLGDFITAETQAVNKYLPLACASQFALDLLKEGRGEFQI